MDVAANIAQLIGFLPTAGQFASILLLAWWLSLERKERIAAQKDANELRDRRASELQAAAETLAELGEATRMCIKDHDASVAQTIALLKAAGGF